MSQDFRKTILIVCEGQRSEPDYFHNLRNEVLENNSDVYIKILPIPKDEQIEIDKDAATFILRRGAKRRQIREAINNEPEEYIIEDKFKAQPTCYVRKAQLAYIEKAYSELWAVYDKDGHTDHKNAYLLSIDEEKCDKIVNIGFSSISFEGWILMHFEFCDTAFLKSQCRDTNKKVYDCGTTSHEFDCHGKTCVVGKIVKNKYLTYNDNKNFNYAEYSTFVNNAFSNALLSRDLAEDKLNFFNNNPYVSLDRLVFKLKKIDKEDLIWIYENTFEIERNVFVRIINENENTFFIISNESNRTFIIQNNLIRLIDIEFKIIQSNSRLILNSKESIRIFSFKNLSIDKFKYALFKINESESKILDIVQIKNFI